MKNYLRLTTYCFILILIISSCKQKITHDDYPDADAVYIKMTKEYTLNDDGSMDYHYSHQLKLFTYFAFNSKYGETFITYNPKEQTLKVNKSFTITDKGDNIPTPENGYNEVLPHFAAGAPASNYLREMVVSHTGLERNVTINLDYNLTTKKDFLPALFGNEILNTSSPIRELDIVVKIQKDKKLYYSLINSDIKPDSSIENNTKIYKWNFKEIKAQSLEAMQPSDNRNMIRILFSTSDNLNNNLSNILSQPAFKSDADEEIVKGISEITKSNKPEINKVLELQKKVVEEFNYFPIPPEYTGYSCRTANEIWKSNGGTEIEKAVLLDAIYKKSGINSEILAISNQYIPEKNKIVMLFDNFILKVNLKNNETLYLSPVHINDNSLIYDLKGKVYYALSNNTKLNYFSEKNYSNSIQISGKLNLKKNITEGKITASFSDEFNPYFNLTVNAESTKSLFSNTKEAKIISLKNDKSEIEFNYENKNSFRKQNNYLFLNLPETNNGFSSWGLNTLTEKRNTTLELNSNIDEKYEYILTLPGNYTLINPVKKITIQNTIGKFEFESEQKGNVFVFRREINIFKKNVDVKDYEKFKSLVNSWNNKKFKDLVLTF